MFRHLHVLASENRCLKALDVETKSEVQAEIQVKLKEDTKGTPSTQKSTTPYLLPALDQVLYFHIHYFPNHTALYQDGRFQMKECVW